MKNLVIVFLLVGTNLTTYFLVSNKEAESSVSPAVEREPVALPQKPAEKDEAAVVTQVAVSDNHTSLGELGDAVLRLEPSPLRAALLEVLAGGWFERDHLGLAEWLNEQPSDVDADRALATFANLASEIDPKGSVEWAASVMTPGLREQALGRAAREYARRDPRGYKNFIDGSSPSARAILNLGLNASYQEESGEAAYRHDIIEEKPEPIARILARRTRLAGSSARVNNVELSKD